MQLYNKRLTLVEMLQLLAAEVITIGEIRAELTDIKGGK